MNYVKSTAEILAFKTLNRNVNNVWINWAVEMLMEGFNSQSLLFLAGENEKSNQFELQRLAENTLKELGLDYSNEDKVIKKYVCYLLDEAITGNKTFKSVLSSLKELYYEVQNDSLLLDFYLLYFAHEDLEFDTIQNYWDNATRENIDQVTKEFFIKRKSECI